MAKRHNIDMKLLYEDFRYDDGKIFWMPRPRDRFATNRAHATWNARYADTEAGTLSMHTDPRVKVNYGGACIYRYQIVWALHHDEWIDQIDHEDTNPTNDRIENLRPSTHSTNGGNSKRRLDNTSGYKGVYEVKRTGGYVAQITFQQKNIYLGYFRDPREAHAAYVEASKRYFKEFHNDGVPSGGLS